MSAEYEDLNGGCPTPANSSVRPAYIYPNNPTINDPWSFYKRTLTFQASHLLCDSLFSLFFHGFNIGALTPATCMLMRTATVLVLVHPDQSLVTLHMMDRLSCVCVCFFQREKPQKHQLGQWPTLGNTPCCVPNDLLQLHLWQVQ